MRVEEVVESRELEFADGVTLIEGPNEIGKSTIVEAIQSLFTVMDSSSKADIKAIQPVGQDVGSSVEAEIAAGKDESLKFFFRQSSGPRNQQSSHGDRKRGR